MTRSTSPFCDDTDRKIAFFTLHTSDRSQRLTALRLRLGERLMFLRGYRPMGGRARRFDGPAGGVHCRSERAVQPFGELLLQICCWCSSGLSEVQFLIAVGADHGSLSRWYRLTSMP